MEVHLDSISRAALKTLNSPMALYRSDGSACTFQANHLLEPKQRH